MITTAQYAIDGTAVKIVPKSEVPKIVAVHAITNGNLFINGANTLTSTTGFLVDKQAGIFNVEIGAEDELWGITDSGTHTFSVFIRYL